MNGDELQEIRGLFLQECSENVDVLESGLLAMEDGATDRDSIDAVFRAAHSIKGGGATFGFDALSELTHHMETYLDQVRSGKAADAQAIGTLLNAVDGLRQMLGSSDPQEQASFPGLDGLINDLKSLTGAPGGSHTDEPTSTAQHTEATVWKIQFNPNPDMATRGNDAYLVLRELSGLGHMSITTSSDSLPELSEYDEKTVHLAFSIELLTERSEADIREVFEWVEFDCTISMEQQVPASEPPIPEPLQASDAPAKPRARGAGATEGSIRIATDKIDRILDLVGELVITQSMLSSAASNGVSKQFTQNLEQLEGNIRELQESVMRVRMLPIAFAFGRLPRIVHDLSARLGKQVDLQFEGENTELDKTVLDHIIDPLVHLTRNAIDHGLETAEARRIAGKPEVGQLRLAAYHLSGAIVIEIEDDGQGIDTDKVLNLARQRGLVSDDAELSQSDIAQLIFAPGFSTADEVTDVSGRGVGMDVVRRNIVELGGKVDVRSERGQGSKVSIQLPLTLAILDGQLVEVGDQVFVVPIINIVETLELRDVRISHVPELGPVAEFRDRCVPLVYLKDHVLAKPCTEQVQERLVLIVESHGRTIGLVIGSVAGQQQVVIKTLEHNFRKIWESAGHPS